MTSPAALSPSVRAFAARAKRVPFGLHSVHVVDEGPRSDEAVVLLHGFPESSFDFRAVIDGLAPETRVVAADFLGFGLSDKPFPHSYSLFEQADVIEVVLRTLGVRKAHLVAHDMGTSVAAELAARLRLGLLGVELASLLMTNGSVYIEMAALTPSQKLLRLPGIGSVFARLASYPVFRAQARRIITRPLEDAALRDMFDLMVHDGGRVVLPSLIGYIAERYRFAERWCGALRELDVPTRVVWGQRDPVAVAAIGERLLREMPRARIERLDDVGHFTPLEAPEELVRNALSLRRGEA